MKHKNYNGISFIELIIYIAIMSIILLSIGAFIASNRKLEKNNQAINEVEFQGTQLVRLITQAVRNSATINSPAAGSSAASLSVNTDTAGNNPTVFDLSSGKLRIKEGAAAAINLNSDQIQIANLSFKNLANTSTKGIVYIKFDVSYTNPGNIPELTYQKTFYVSAQER